MQRLTKKMSMVQQMPKMSKLSKVPKLPEMRKSWWAESFPLTVEKWEQFYYILCSSPGWLALFSSILGILDHSSSL